MYVSDEAIDAFVQLEMDVRKATAAKPRRRIKSKESDRAKSKARKSRAGATRA